MYKVNRYRKNKTLFNQSALNIDFGSRRVLPNYSVNHKFFPVELFRFVSFRSVPGLAYQCVSHNIPSNIVREESCRHIGYRLEHIGYRLVRRSLLLQERHFLTSVPDTLVTCKCKLQNSSFAADSKYD